MRLSEDVSSERGKPFLRDAHSDGVFELPQMSLIIPDTFSVKLLHRDAKTKPKNCKEQGKGSVTDREIDGKTYSRASR